MECTIWQSSGLNELEYGHVAEAAVVVKDKPYQMCRPCGVDVILRRLILSEIGYDHGTCFAPQLKSSGGVPVAAEVGISNRYVACQLHTMM